MAPVNGAVVGEATRRATRALFEYERLDPVLVKGKADPVPIGRVLGARSRPGIDLTERPPAPLIGRGARLETLRRRRRRTFGEHALLLVTVLGEPGVGKSRLLRELAASVCGPPSSSAWRPAPAGAWAPSAAFGGAPRLRNGQAILAGLQAAPP